MNERQKQIEPSKVVFARSWLTQVPTELTAKRPIRPVGRVLRSSQLFAESVCDFPPHFSLDRHSAALPGRPQSSYKRTISVPADSKSG